MGYEAWDVAHVPAYPNQEDSKEFTARPAIIIEDLQDEVALCFGNQTTASGRKLCLCLHHYEKFTRRPSNGIDLRLADRPGSVMLIYFYHKTNSKNNMTALPVTLFFQGNLSIYYNQRP